MKIAVITDTHWGVRNDSAVFSEHLKKFHDTVFFPKIDELGIDTVIHLGDLADRRKYINYTTAKNLEEHFMEPLRKRNMTLHLTLGNHDTYFKNTNEVNCVRQLYGNSYYQKFHFYEHDPVELEFDGTKVMLSPWICEENARRSYDRIRSTDAQVLMGHFEIQGFEMMKGYLCEHGMDKKIFTKFDSVYSGHFHHPSSHSNITYLGAPYEMTWSDYQGKRGFHVFDTDDRTMTFVPNPFRMFYKLDYDDTDMTIEDVENLDTTPLTGSYIKVIVKRINNSYVFDLFQDKLEKSGAADIKIVEDQTVETVDEEIEIDEAQDTLTIINNFIDHVDSKGDKDKAKRLMVNLYQEALNL